MSYLIFGNFIIYFMGYYFIDKYSLLLFSFGILWNYFGLDLISLIILHILFEYFENTKIGMRFINNYFTLWPGGKEHPDSLVNSVSDVLFSVLGWIFYRNYVGNIGKNELGVVALTMTLFFWLSGNKILILFFMFSLLFIFIGRIKYIIYMLIGLGISYLVNFIDNRLELFS